MTSISQTDTPTPTDIPGELGTAFEALMSAQRSFADFRSDLANALYLDFRRAEDLSEFFDQSERAGRLPNHLNRVLQSDIRRICSEDGPTIMDPAELATRQRQTRLEDAAAQLPAEATHEDVEFDSGAEPTELLRAPASSHESPKPNGYPRHDDVLLGRYELLELAGSGGMSTVYKAKDRRAAGTAQEWVAIKFLSEPLLGDEQALRALMSEAEIGRSLRHPDIVRFLDSGQDESLYFIVIEWLDGEPLSVKLSRAPGVAWSSVDALQLVETAGAALQYLHDNGMAHSDVSPANIMLMESGAIKLLDLGVSRAPFADAGDDDSEVPFDPSVLGAATPAYSSADVLQGADPTPTDDIYALACLYYRLVSGTRVFGKATALEAREWGYQPNEIEGMPHTQWLALRAALSHSRQDRPADVREFVRSLSSQPQFGVPEPQAQMTTRRGVGRAALVGIVVALAGLGAALAYKSGAFDGVADLYANARERTQSPSAGDADVLDEGTSGEPIDAPPPATAAGPDALPPRGEGATSAQPAGDTKSNTAGVTEPTQRAGNIDPNTAGTSESPGDEADPFATKQTATVPSEAEPATGSRESESGIATSRSEPQELPVVSAGTAAAPEPGSVVESDVEGASLTPALPTDSYSFPKASMSVSESQSAILVNVLRLNPSPGAAAVNFAIAGGSAQEGFDYFAPTVSRLEFAAGENEAKIYIPLIDDARGEKTESLSVELFGERGAAGLVTMVSIDVFDDDH